jgi:nucleotide-binding universal stress UspA family protein
MPSIRKILVATDFTDASDAAIDSALELAASLHASVILAHTYELPVYGIGDPNLVMPMVNVASDLDRALDETMRSEVDSRRDRGVPLGHIVRMGPAADAVNAAAEEIGADLIVVGTHGRKGLAHALLGSTAESILRAATRTVLVVRSNPAGADAEQETEHGRARGTRSAENEPEGAAAAKS